jgi:hypothetical protein
MGTNYYLHKSVCEHCGRGDERQHIGKSSAGWCFSLRVDDTVRSLDDWRAAWAQPGVEIKDEYGETVPPAEMERIILDRSWPRRGDSLFDYVGNGAEPGPNGLTRHKIGRWCIAHGDGTYDLIPGEFS